MRETAIGGTHIRRGAAASQKGDIVMRSRAARASGRVGGERRVGGDVQRNKGVEGGKTRRTEQEQQK